MKRPQRSRRGAGRTTYTLLHELAASTTQPLPGQHIRHQLTRMSGGLHDLVHGANPSTDSWRVLSDAVNLLETLVTEGAAPERDAQGRIVASHWLDCDGEMVEVRDSTGLLQDAIAALAHAGQRALQGQPIRLDGPGLAAVRAVLEDYQAALQALPARTMVRCHRLTEQRVRRVWDRMGHPAGEVQVMAL